MRILLLSESVPNAPTGVRIHYTNLADNLRKLGHIVDVITPYDVPKAVHYPLSAFTRILTKLGRAAHEFAIETDNQIRLYFALLPKKHIKYDIVNAQEVGSGAVAKRIFRNRVPVAVTCHFNDDPATEKIRRRGLSGFSADLLRRWYRSLFSKIDYLNGVSNYTLQKPKHLFKKNAVVELIHNSIDFDEIDQVQPDDAFRNKYADRKIIMNIGYFEKRKNQRMVIEVARLLKDIRPELLFVLIGDGEDSELIQGMVDEYSLKENVLLLGRIENVVPILKCADLYLHTAINESFGLVIMEAIACRVPVKAFAVGGVPELVSHKQSLLESTSTPEQVAATIQQAFDNYEQTTEIERQQYAYASQRFHIRAMTEGYLNFYKTVVKHFASSKKTAPATIAEPISPMASSLAVKKQLRNRD